MFYALKKVREQGVDFRCIVVGTGPDEQLVKEQCSSMGLDDITTFTGHVSNVQEQLGKGDIYVLPSYCDARDCLGRSYGSGASLYCTQKWRRT